MGSAIRLPGVPAASSTAAAEIERMRTLMETTLARHTGKDAATIRKDTDRDKILTADEAKDYGIIDTVLEYRKLSAQTA